MKHYIPHICVAIGVIIAQIMCLFLEGSHIDNLFGFYLNGVHSNTFEIHHVFQ
jgi:hypothetical protein